MIASVLLIAFAVTLFLIISTWVQRSVVEPGLEDSEGKIAGALECGNVYLNVNSAKLTSSTGIKLGLENMGDKEVKGFNIKIIGSDGAELGSRTDTLDVLDGKSYDLNFNPANTGAVFGVEVYPIVESGVCTNRPGKKDILPSSCSAVLGQNPGSSSGAYTIYPGGNEISVYCDMVTDGGGWTRVLNAVQVTNWANIRVNEVDVLAGTSDQAKDDSKNGWVGLQYWPSLGGRMRQKCTGGGSGNQEGEGDFSLDTSNNYQIDWDIGGGWGSWNNNRELSTLDYDRGIWSGGNCVTYHGHESSGWGWHAGCHIGSAWFGEGGNRNPICHVKPGATYAVSGWQTTQSDHTEWFIR